MKIWIGFKKINIRPIEWADKDHKEIIGFLCQCPYCSYNQWNCAANFYIAFDGTKRNLRCKSCGVGKSKPGDRIKRKFVSHDVFSPRTPGWRSIIKKCAKHISGHTKEEQYRYNAVLTSCA